MLLILLASIAVPLRRALLQVASETITRGTVQTELKRFVPADAIVSQQVSLGRDDIAIHLISTKRIPESKVTELRQDLMRRTGRNVQLSVDAVASKSELAELMERLDPAGSRGPEGTGCRRNAKGAAGPGPAGNPGDLAVIGCADAGL